MVYFSIDWNTNQFSPITGSPLMMTNGMSKSAKTHPFNQFNFNYRQFICKFPFNIKTWIWHQENNNIYIHTHTYVYRMRKKCICINNNLYECIYVCLVLQASCREEDCSHTKCWCFNFSTNLVLMQLGLLSRFPSWMALNG